MGERIQREDMINARITVTMTFDTKGAQSIKCFCWASPRGLHPLGGQSSGNIPIGRTGSLDLSPWTTGQGTVSLFVLSAPLPLGTSDLPPHPAQARQACDLP